MGGKRLSRADVLEAWRLPGLAKAVRNDDKQAEDDETIASIEWLDKMFGGN